MSYRILSERVADSVEKAVGLLERGVAALERIADSLEGANQLVETEPAEIALNSEGQVWLGNEHASDVDMSGTAKDAWRHLVAYDTRKNLRDNTGINIFVSPGTLSVVSIARVREAMKYLPGVRLTAAECVIIQGWIDAADQFVATHLQAKESAT